ncbi:FAD-dependent oxidoreductase [Mycoplasmopsis caviae]|uniref:FAD-dependent oxidoreductase n=1 Tax=Mycoplasmopsis caviae TaxID=55603 RepID=A0A3P8MEH5_9BACT|nr:FAD-dependent oxidoreductase [Mycoplasmopsis caviae]UUD35477.1 FAD-dependent oxidoreductase [Mycoplasmopsis caviae]VDR41746.1 thioredoxin-disulfide reductase [Mycoplasmopsis caviae]
MDKKEVKQFDVLIIGSGPAGLNAALYTSRANLSVAFIDNDIYGGKIQKTAKVDNYLGIEDVSGFDLAQKFYQHAIKYGAKHLYGKVVKINSINQNLQEAILENGDIIQAKKLIIASGMVNRKPSSVVNFDKFAHHISYCAICDGAIYKNRKVVVLGGGNSAVEEGTFLAKLCSQVSIITNQASFSAEKELISELEAQKNVDIYYNSELVALNGDESLSSVTISNKLTNKQTNIETDGFFVFIGFIPNQDAFKHLKITTKDGFVKTNEDMETKVKGIYAIGDIRDKKVRQIITAASDGAIASKHISDMLKD